MHPFIADCAEIELKSERVYAPAVAVMKLRLFNTVVPTGKSYLYLRSTMKKCVKPVRHLATSCTKSSKWSGLIGRAGTKSR